MKRSIFVFALALSVLIAPAAFADTAINAGTDLWFTPANGATLDGVDAPLDFFCNSNSPEQTLPNIPMKGFPLVTSPDLSPVDTVIERPYTKDFVNNVVETKIRIQALMLTSVNSLTIDCGTFNEYYTVYVALEPQADGHQPEGDIEIRRSSPAATGGRFDASFDVLGRAYFVNNASGQVLGPISHDPQTVTTVNACWSHVPGPGAFEQDSPFAVDTDGDQVVDAAALATSNFFPGWCPPAGGGGGGGVPTPEPVEHEGPHPETCASPGCPQAPPTPCDPDVVFVIGKHVIEGVGLNVKGAATDLARLTAKNAATQTQAIDLSVARVQKCAVVLGADMFGTF